MGSYEEKMLYELNIWQQKMIKKPSLTGQFSKGIQNKFNDLIPDKVHETITSAVKNMVKAVLFGSDLVSKPPVSLADMEERENMVRSRLDFYKKTAAVSGAGTGAGGLLLGLADFPILLSLKIKFLYETAGIYGFDIKDYRERIFILYIFQLAFSNQRKVNEIYVNLRDWDNYVRNLPEDINSFDWMTFQQEYRDYIDIAKMLQLVPGIGAFVGAYANYKLVNKLGDTAMNAYRMRLKAEGVL